MVFCSGCGLKNETSSKFCSECGTSLKHATSDTLSMKNNNNYEYFEEQPRYSGNQQYEGPSVHRNNFSNQGFHQSRNVNIVRVVSRKDPTLAAIISFFFPGIGYAYIGQTGKAIGYFFLIIFTYLILIGFIIHIYVIIDSYNECKKVNAMNGYYEGYGY